MQHNISITVINNSTGVAPQANGVMMIFAQAVATSTFLLNTPYLLTQISDLTDRGVDADYDADNLTYVYGQVNDFYTQAGAGALLWVVGVPYNTAYATYVTTDTFTQMIQFTALADPLNRAKMIGLCYAPPQLISEVATFTGSGLDDATYSGAYNSATLPATYTVAIDGLHGAKTIVLNAGGATTYAVNDVLTIVQGGASGATARVTAVTAGVVTGIVLVTAGTGYTVANGLATTGGGGTGCTINITAVVDTFKWKYNGGSFTTGVAITGLAQTLSNGISITIAALLGHTLTDQWVDVISAGNANTATDDFPADVAAGITALQAAQLSLFNQGYQFSAIYDGYNMNWATAPSALTTQATNSAYSVSLCITGGKGNGVSAVGLSLGRFARIGIGHGVGAVADGPMVTANAFLTNGVSAEAGNTLAIAQAYTVYGGTITYNSVEYGTGETFTTVAGHGTFTTTDGAYVVANSSYIPNLTFTDINQLGAKQFFFLRTWMNHSGFYWNDGATCTSSTLQLSTQEYNRVANALAADCLNFFIDQMGANLPLQANGAVAQGYLNAKQAEFYNTYISPLTVQNGTGDITDASMVLSALNFNSTKTMNFALTIQPTPILGNVVGTIQFSSTL